MSVLRRARRSPAAGGVPRRPLPLSRPCASLPVPFPGLGRGPPAPSPTSPPAGCPAEAAGQGRAGRGAGASQSPPLPSTGRMALPGLRQAAPRAFGWSGLGSRWERAGGLRALANCWEDWKGRRVEPGSPWRVSCVVVVEATVLTPASGSRRRLGRRRSLLLSLQRAEWSLSGAAADPHGAVPAAPGRPAARGVVGLRRRE